MNNFKSLKIGTVPLLLAGCSVIAFGVTHFYFKNPELPEISDIFGHLLLFPVYLFEEIAARFGNSDVTSNIVVVFSVLMVTYSFLVIGTNKILSMMVIGKKF